MNIQNRRKKWLFAGILALGGALILLLLLELGVRVLLPQINAQDTDRRLYQERAFGQSVGWVPGSRGLSFGVEAVMDDLGFRKIESPAGARRNWLLLGDSVTFGVGVANKQVFAQLVQDQLADTRVINSAVVGYSVPNYRDVVREMLKSRMKPDRVTMFLCLNDIYGNLDLAPKVVGVRDRVLNFLREHSRLYVAAKDLATDRSRQYFMYDYAMYSDGGKELSQAIDAVAEMALALKSEGVMFDVVLLPYEYQLRRNEDDLWRPQKMITSMLRAKSIHVIDIHNELDQSGHDSREYYLYGDPMHLSTLGHQIVAKALISNSAARDR